jgi:hypothetical protein
MKRTAFGIAVVIGTYAFAAASPRIAPMGKVASSCTLGGKKLYGKVKVVDHFPDFTIQYVDHFPDFEIKKVSHFPGLP